MRHNFIGIVISTAMDKTVRVQVAKRVMVHRFQKEVLRHKVYMAHDEMENCNNGDVVRIEHCRKLSRHKSFAIAEVIKPARSWTDPETGIAAQADVTTKEFAAPKVPAPPQNDINLESDMKTYEQTGTLGQ
ncbi:hypothetical protein LPJ62_001197 [Coemansia sp. RSA 2167]|nr:hypothetical protein LPJ62_001197 [Coemansia sp. RSA 2167]